MILGEILFKECCLIVDGNSWIFMDDFNNELKLFLSNKMILSKNYTSLNYARSKLTIIEKKSYTNTSRQLFNVYFPGNPKNCRNESTVYKFN